MKHALTTRVMALLLAVLMAVGMLPLAVFAAEAEEITQSTAATASASGSSYDTSVSGEYFNVLSEETYDLAPGAVEREIVLNNDDGSDRKVAHIIEVDPTSTQVEVLPGYYEIDKFDPEDSTTWKTAGVTVTAAYYEEVLGYNVVGAMNTALAYDSNAPYAFMVYNGEVLGTPDLHKGAQTYLAVMKNDDGTMEFELRSTSTALTGDEWQAVSANFGWLVKDGVLTTTTVERTSSDASRSMLGIKADGSLVICQVDGRNAPVSTGLSNYEMGEMMLALGCVWAINGDGGGSSSFVTKRAGSDEQVMRSVPSDGSERPTINSIIVVSKVTEPSGIFDYAVVDADTDYVAPGASVAMTAAGVDTNGFPVEVPADATWQVMDGIGGTVTDGVFTAGTETGSATVQLVYNGAVVGEKVLTIVHPETFGFDADSTVLPYGKSMELVVNATYGEDDWAVSVDGAYTVTLSDPAAATLTGSILTATSDETVAGVDVTITYNADATLTDVLAVSFGKGSEIVFDFEDGDISEWMGFDEAKQWNIDNGVENTLTTTEPIGGQFSPSVDSNTFLASTDNGGQVKNGQYALGVNLDNRYCNFANWTYNILYRVGAPVVLRDVANGKEATSFGAWVYIPEGAAGMAMQLTVYKGTSAETATSGTQLHFYFTAADGTRKNLNSCTEADIPESRWVYASVDLTANDYVSLVDPTGNIYREPTFIRTYIKPTEPAVHTFYFDDFTLDYSSAVEDRILPTVSETTYATADESQTLAEGAEISGNTMSFSAKVADASLNAASGRILVDGIAVEASVANGVLSCGNVTLTSGVHTVTFEIEDALGNLGKATRTFTVSGTAAITLTGHNDSGAAPEYGSVYYVDLNAADVSNVNGLTVTLKLQNANAWETAGMSVADGYQVTACTINEKSNELTLTIAKTADTELTGAAALVSIPVRVWSWNTYDHITGEEITAEKQFSTGNCPVVTIDCEVVAGEAVYADGAFGAFGGVISVATNLNDNVNPWHYHDETLTTSDCEATCLTDGYEGRTYCETCQSVVDWGTVIPATGHTYEIVEDQLVCACGASVTGNGLVTVNGKIYCLIADKLVTGWQAVGTGWCYAAVSTKEVQTGEFTVDGLTYTADESGIVIKGAWVTDETGTRYSYGPAYYKRTWAEIDGATYYFDEDTYMFTGIQYIPVNRNNLSEGIIWYEFAEDGKYIGKVNGFVTYNDLKYYVVEGEFNYGGLMLIDGDYYYARTSGQLVCGQQYWITKTNDLLPAGFYTFDDEGKMTDAPGTEEPEQPTDPVEPEVLNGIVEENGKLYWYVDGVKTYGGLMLIDGAYYYARSTGEIICNQQYWITKTNDLLPAAYYTFGVDGKMTDAPETEEPEQPTDPVEPEVLNGIVEENGKLYWYVDGVKTYGGLMLIDGAYYYARSTGEIICNQRYWITKTNDLLPAAYYTFGADGKMTDAPETEEPEQPTDPVEPEVLNGIVEENGVLYWYVDGVKTYGGLLHLDTDGDGNADAYYYARTSGEIVCGKQYWITKTNDLLPAGFYTFGEDGKMVQ